jgi:transaldolase / glucose-6-phosphate isomerase
MSSGDRMAIPTQTIVGGCLQSAFHRELKYFLDNRLLNRLWAKDATLWPEEEFEHSHIRSNLDWLDLPNSLQPFLEAIKQEESAALADGLDRRVLITFENANLGARALMAFVPPDATYGMAVLDSTCPFAISLLERELHLARTLFIFASKEGYRLEDHALFLYLLEKLQSAGVPQPLCHFVAQTEPGSYLASISREYKFRAVFHDLPGILASFTSIKHLGAILTSLFKMEPEAIVSAAKAMQKGCSPGAIPAENPALQLAAFLSCAALAKREYLALLASPTLVPYTHCLSQLIGGSMAKEGPGLIPLAGDVPRDTRALEDKAVFAILTYAGDADTELTDLMSRFRFSGVPFVYMQVAEPLDLLPGTFGWQAAIVLSCARLGFDPFQGADDRLPRALAMEILNNYSPNNDTLARKPRVKEGGLQLFAEGQTRRELSVLNLQESFGSFFRLLQPDSFLAVLVLLPSTPRVVTAFQAIRRELTEKLKVPVLMVYGPHALPHYSNLGRKGQPQGQYLVCTADPPVDIAIPGASYTFGQLCRALALGEFEALEQSHHFAIRINLTGEISAALASLQHAIGQALSRAQ